MIATRLHAKRHSGSTPNRPSIISIHGTSQLHHPHQQHRRTSKRPSDDIQNIDSDNINIEDDDDEVDEGTKVENISSSFFNY
jgi:hypothetical protein